MTTVADVKGALQIANDALVALEIVTEVKLADEKESRVKNTVIIRRLESDKARMRTARNHILKAEYLLTANQRRSRG